MRTLIKNQAGFTLLEIMIVIVLMGLLVGFIAPNMLSFNRRQTLTNAVVAVRDGLQQAQNMAVSGVQGEASFIARYRFKFLNNPGDPANAYRGFEVRRINEGGSIVTPNLSNTALACPVCINSTVSEIDFRVPSGQVEGFLGSSTNFSVCYAGVGQQQVSVDLGGRVTVGDFQTTTCTCAVNACQ